jgi:hypothetical protein
MGDGNGMVVEMSSVPVRWWRKGGRDPAGLIRSGLLQGHKEAAY